MLRRNSHSTRAGIKSPAYHSVHLVAEGNAFARAVNIAHKHPKSGKVAIAGPYLDRSHLNGPVEEPVPFKDDEGKIQTRYRTRQLKLPGLEENRKQLAHVSNLEMGTEPLRLLRGINSQHGPGSVSWIDVPFSLAGAEGRWSRIAKKTGATSSAKGFEYERWWERPIELTDQLAAEAFEALHEKGRLTACVPEEIADGVVSKLERAGFQIRRVPLEDEYRQGEFSVPVELSMAMGSGSHRTTGALKDFVFIVGRKPG